ncbi:hypothetical protein N9I87_03715, partial [Gammaproteobacteria bacterium]|nr:hypothetical protein [Gammaproteobacteria bacterium]
MSKIFTTTAPTLGRRAFLRNASVAALASGTAATTLFSESQAQGTARTMAHTGMKFDFDTPYNRVGSSCARWDGAARGYPEGVFKYGMGVASQDFECAPCITEALEERIKHHNWGYLSDRDGLVAEIVKWNGNRNQLDLDPKT